MQFFEDFQQGDILRFRGRTITETDIVNSNEEAAKGAHSPATRAGVVRGEKRFSMFGARVADGALVFSISTGLWTQLDALHETVVAFYGIDRLRFTKPVHIGDTIQLTKKVLSKEERSADRGLVTFETTVVNQKVETVLAYSDKLLIRRRQ
ncbi:MAG TPA: MaoC/PaaZ C-terminal domain-containing protein [Bryobacteraceae bacterium]|jgi:acyl dehydratase|nr:MaoC/PaaZ C-terminal domain-containing protein [Bryobacteraceae bacterium]